MSARRPTTAQRAAADPARSVWVTANAGTGKTGVLTDRVLRLLLAGVAAESVLCITFTRAAAAEMIERIERRLAGWATATEPELAAALEALTGVVPDAELRARARRLLAQVLELARGLPVMTIHAFCTSLLRRFPLEAGVAPHFEVIDEATTPELLRAARDEVLARARDQDSPLGKAVAELAVLLGDRSLTEALEELVAQRGAITRALAQHGGLEGLLAALQQRLGLEPAATPGELVAAACRVSEPDSEALAQAAAALEQGSAGDAERGRAIRVWLSAAPADRARLFDAYLAAFLTSEGKGRKTLASKSTPDQDGVSRILLREQARLLRVRGQLKAAGTGARTAALLRVGAAVLDAYETRKALAAGLDYEDQIARAVELLHRPGISAWVRFKLDARIEHVLVDEAQDTSPEQWRVIEALVDEFFAGAGARTALRTLFVVGDEKQSIYGFQGADLANFRQVRGRLRDRAAGAGRPLHETLLDRSFRSVPAVLEVVDAVFALAAARPGVVAGEVPLVHTADRQGVAGLVELWPLARHPPAAADAEPWPLPDRPRPSGEPELRVARAIARRIRRWLDEGEMLAGRGRPVRAGDVLILLQRRGTLQELLVRELKQHGIPVAGADRIALTSHIAVMDLMALGQALLLPEDDLILACALRSPLFALDDQALEDLAAQRAGMPLIARLRERAAQDPDRYGAALARFERWQARADLVPPFELFAWVLGPEAGRQRLLARLGPDAAEPIDAFLARALAFERGRPSSLQGFLRWLETAGGELRRDAGRPQDQVRVTTVHGAKGLEAPIVILADAGPRGGARGDRLIWDETAAGAALPFWRAAAAERDPYTEQLVQAEQRRLEDESRRLLYVALTRAADRLYVTGWLPRKGEDGGTCWHALIERALRALGASEEQVELGPDYGGPLLRHATGRPVPPQADLPGLEPPPPLPAWAKRPAPPEPRPPRPLAPSRLAGDEPAPAAPLGAAARARLRRGALVHKLLQLLPDLADQERPAAAARFLRLSAADLAPVEQQRLVAEVLGVVRDPRLVELFAPGSRAEQAICGLIDGLAVAGQVDRLAITATRITIADFKSGVRVPERPDAVPVAYLRQLAAYRAVMRALFPDRAVEAVLIWTEGPRIMPLPPALLDTHLPPAAADPPA